MQLFSPAKINLTLQVLGLRPDGYHALDSVVVPLSLGDDVTLEKAEMTAVETISDTVELLALPEDPERNLAVRAVRLLEREAGRSLPTRLFIKKRIPLGGGLGGGSSNAATVLRGMDALWGLGLPMERLCALGAELGSDVPLFLLDGTVRMRGRGEYVERVPMPGAPPLWVVLANDGSHCSTPQVYAAFDAGTGTVSPWNGTDSAGAWANVRPQSLRSQRRERRESGGSISEARRAALPDHVEPSSSPPLTKGAGLWDTLRFFLQSGDPSRVAKEVRNDLERPCCGLFPGVARTAEALRAAGCAGVTLCGSGATVFGLVRSREEGEQALAYPALAGCWRACVQTLPDGVMAAHGPLTPIVMVRIHVGQP